MKNTLPMVKSHSVFYKRDQCYSITINPEDKYQFVGKPDRMQLFRSTIAGIFMEYPQFKTDYYLMVELSEPREVNTGIGPRLHVHGTIRFRSNKAVRKFLLDNYYKLTRLGHVEIDIINDHDIWNDYIHKQWDILQERPISNFDTKQSMMETLFGDTGTGEAQADEDEVCVQD